MALLTLPTRRDRDTTGWADIGRLYLNFLDVLAAHDRACEQDQPVAAEKALKSMSDIAHRNPEFIRGSNDSDTRFRPLSYCAVDGLLHASEWLLAQGADPMQRGKHQDLLPIHDAAMGSTHASPAFIELLTRQLGPSVLLEMCFAGTPLHVAALAGNTGGCLSIVETQTAAFDELDWAGKTALESALRRKPDRRHESTISALRSWDARRSAHQALRDAGLPAPTSC